MIAWLKTIPVLRSRHLTPEKVKPCPIADNKLAELSGWSVDLLKTDGDGPGTRATTRCQRGRRTDGVIQTAKPERRGKAAYQSAVITKCWKSA